MLHGAPQSRYLWVDAWGVLSFVSLARDCGADSEDRRDILAAARSLIATVHAVLGAPCTRTVPMSERRGSTLGGADSTLSGYKGLRIGKVQCKLDTDFGMSCDGMYWHYVDKWVYALARYAREAEDVSILRDAVQVLLDVHPSFFEGSGMHWKLNVDLRPIRGHEYDVAPSSDAATAWVVFDVLRQTAEAMGDRESARAIEPLLAEVRSNEWDVEFSMRLADCLFRYQHMPCTTGHAEHTPTHQSPPALARADSLLSRRRLPLSGPPTSTLSEARSRATRWATG